MDEKAIKILEIIVTSGPITGPDISQKLEAMGIHMNIKTVRQVIQDWNYLFSQMGDGTMHISGQRKIGFQLNHSYFNQAQKRFLTDSIQASPLLNQNEKQNLLQLCTFFPLKADLQAGSRPQSFLARLELIQQAIDGAKTIRFSYIDFLLDEGNREFHIKKEYRPHGNDPADPSHETYLVSPYEIVLNKGFYYLLSFCDKHPNNLTIFRVDRMERVRQAKAKFDSAQKETSDYEQKKRQMVNMYVGQQCYAHIRIRFKKTVLKTVLDQFGQDIKLSRDVSGDPILELEDFAISEGLISWIMMMGDQVEVLSPASLIDEIYRRFKQLAERYRSSRNGSDVLQ